MKTYKERVHRLYRVERSNNVRAVDALRSARFEAKYERQAKHEVFENWRKTEVDMPFGFTLVFKLEADDYPNCPWDDYRYNDVSVVKESREHPGESYEKWILNRDHGWYRYYDWKKALPIAIKEEWDSPPYMERDKQIKAMRAMESECDFFRRWCDDQWQYLWYCVELLDPNGNEIDSDSCGGYESESMSYIVSEARDAAARMLWKARREFFANRGDSWKQRELELELVEY